MGFTLFESWVFGDTWKNDEGAHVFLCLLVCNFIFNTLNIMKSRRILLLLAILSCTSVAFAQQRTDKVEYQESSARNLEPVQSVMISPMIADMEVTSEKIYYTETEAFRNYTVSPAIVSLIPEFKKVALSRAARAYKADAIVGATVDVITNADGRIEITISGYPAHYTNFRNATRDDVALVGQAKAVASGNDNEILKNPKSRTNLTIEK